MRALCVSNTADALDPEALRSFRENVHQDSVDLVPGQIYPLWGVFFRKGVPWYLVCEDPSDSSPRPHLAALFQLVDGSVPAGWSYCVESSNLASPALLPTPWARDPRFLERLVDEEPGALAVFEEMKRLAG